jgi:hypothetical protein
LVASHPQDTNAVRHGLHSRSGRVLAPRVEEIAKRILDSAHTGGMDDIGAEEIGRLIVLIEAVDDEITKRGLRLPPHLRDLGDRRRTAS